MSRRNKILIIIAILLIIAVLILLWFLFFKKNPVFVSGEKQIPKLLEVQNLTPRITAEQPKAKPADLARQTIEALARVFAERFVSYSNQSGYLNVTDLYPLMTPSTQRWTSGTYISKLKAENPTDGQFYGISTRTINIKSVKITDGENAEAVVSTQREETKGAGVPRIFYQDIELKFLRINQSWLVDWVRWL